MWVVYSESRTVDVYRPDRGAESFEEGNELTGGNELPDFRCRVADLFALPGSAPA